MVYYNIYTRATDIMMLIILEKNNFFTVKGNPQQ